MRVGFQATIKRSRIRELSERGQQMAARRNLEIATLALAIWLQLVPVDTGDLKSTGRVEFDARTGTARLIAGGVAKSGNIVDYAAIVEAEQPAMRPAIKLAMSKSRNRSYRFSGVGFNRAGLARAA